MQGVEKEVSAIKNPPSRITYWLKRINAVVMQYNKPDGLIPNQVKTRIQVCFLGATFLALLATYHTYNILNHTKANEEAKANKFMRGMRITSLSFVGVFGLMAYSCYTVYQMIPESKIQENVQLFDEAFIKAMKQKKQDQILRQSIIKKPSS